MSGLASELDLLFDRWRKHWDRNGVKARFITDGIVDEEQWRLAKTKVLFVLREANCTAADEWDLREFLRTPPWERTDWKRPGTTWHNITRCAYGLINHPCTFEITDQKYRGSGMLRRIAAINIKKTPGTDHVNWREIERFARMDSALIREQVEIIKPTLIVCGGTFEYLCNALQIPYAKQDNRKTWKSSLLIGVRHPGGRTSKRDYFRDVVTFVYE